MLWSGILKEKSIPSFGALCSVSELGVSFFGDLLSHNQGLKGLAVWVSWFPVELSFDVALSESLEHEAPSVCGTTI